MRARVVCTINLKPSFLSGLKRLVVVAVFGMLFASFIGSALVERIVKRAVEDRLSVGAMETCVGASCLPSHFPFD